ncbi:hypothetical protein Q4I28_005508 [Leishmania naiffi]|uniref:Uncharacterized protein n=7 Tax=Viannia TaxID=37616 RepID=A4HH00_LEIBR|nr:conserved hypothetical protein [Leishmania braziliensis MHOM/BR/75/M2904]CAJ2476152.1 unnamed protein product [Leishmania braziliensis]CCM17146.1 hypothetical protein, conserved [Leishmania guyanensis]CAJ2476687.1 unnamed protein product [Leishmania braziliensis]CAM39849.1 conserved hypothetical protein [Leishmania braziliensis MHOM/BR/75/M2904]SYZ67514.1 hypothetical_protein [Leishmania braziliensis MHOM/BR/75/M2904]
MNRGVKHGRVETPSPAPSSRESTSPAPLAESLPAATNVRTSKRQEAKKYLPDTLLPESAASTSVYSDESFHIESSREREEAVLAEGRCLSGDALKNFLQKNFVDYIDDELFDVAALEALED